MKDKEVKEKAKKQKVSFKKLLTNCCQDRFQKMHVREKNLLQSLKDLDYCTDQVNQTNYLVWTSKTVL